MKVTNETSYCETCERKGERGGAERAEEPLRVPSDGGERCERKGERIPKSEARRPEGTASRDD